MRSAKLPAMMTLILAGLVASLPGPAFGQAQTEQPRQQDERQRTRARERAEREGTPLSPQQRNLLQEMSQAFRSAARSIQDSVVHIEVTSGGRQREGASPRRSPRGLPDQQGIPEDLREQLRRFFGEDVPFFQSPGPQMPRRQRGLGSGIIMDKEGHILTNTHVVGAEGATLTVKTPDGREYPGEVVGTDPLTDVAVIKIENGRDLTPARFADTERVEVGDLVLAVGNPFGLDFTVTMGIVSATGRSGLMLPDIYYQDFIQTDAAINPGNSGGPLVNVDGEVVGLNTAIATQTGSYAGVGFAIPIDLAQQIARQLIERGEVIRGWLGVSIDELEPGMAETFGVEPGTGVLIQDVVPDSPAREAGFKPGDIVLQVNDQAVRTPQQLQRIVTLTPPGEKVNFTVLREGERIEMTATLGKLEEDMLTRGMPGRGGRGMPSRDRYESERLGLTVATPTKELAEQYQWTEVPEGALVIEVEPGGQAAENGIQPGDVITSVSNRQITSARDLEQALRDVSEQRGFRLRVVNPVRGGRYMYFRQR